MSRQGRKHNETRGIAAEHLRSFIERIERLEGEKAAIAEDIKQVYAEAKGNGFDTKTMKQIIRLREMDQAEREEHEALLDIYKAALGMLGGTPLGEAALRKLSGETAKDAEEANAETALPKDAETAEDAAPKKPKPPEPTVEEAREMARKAAAEGQPVTSNPFPARDPRRAAWDEEWCRSTGTDGMELPEAWRRSPKKQEKEHDPDEEAA